jgi:hypothetical protein
MCFAEKEKEMPSSPSNKVSLILPIYFHLGLARSVARGKELAATM